MQVKSAVRTEIWLSALAIALLAGCGGGDAPAIKALAQTITFVAAPNLLLKGSAIVTATASSGLAISYSSATPAVCSVHAGTGLVTDIAAGNCVIAADQSGDDEFAPAPQVTQGLSVLVNPLQTIGFATAPALSLYGTANVSATASSGLPLSYSSSTPTVCTVDSSTGLVTDIAAGNCTIAADQAGDGSYKPAAQVTQTIAVAAIVGITVPGNPTGVTATLGNTLNSVLISFTSPASSGGSPVTSYTATSNPGGITATASASPISVTCPAGCAGYAFAVRANNSAGSGTTSEPADVLTSYKVTATFLEPMTQPKNSIFSGSFTFNSTSRTVTDLRGVLSESMTGGQLAYPNDNMSWLPLNFQLSAIYDANLGGLLVSTFLLPSTNTLSTNPTFGGTDGWAPGSGFGLYYGFPAVNPGNAYARIFVKAADPSASLTQVELDKLAYADCAPGGMMGGTCMTGTSVAGYGTLGSMSGYPLMQVITRQQ